MKEKVIGEKIYSLRKNMGLSQEELAFRLGVSRQSISKWEADIMQPNADNIKALCQFFQVKADYFFGEDRSRVDCLHKELTATNTESDSIKIDIKNRNAKKFFIEIIVLSVLSFFSTIITIVIGFTTLTTNKGDAVYITKEIDDWTFMIFLVVTLILLTADIFLIFRRKKK